MFYGAKSIVVHNLGRKSLQVPSRNLIERLLYALSPSQAYEGLCIFRLRRFYDREKTVVI